MRLLPMRLPLPLAVALAAAIAAAMPPAQAGASGSSISCSTTPAPTASATAAAFASFAPTRLAGEVVIPLHLEGVTARQVGVASAGVGAVLRSAAFEMAYRLADRALIPQASSVVTLVDEDGRSFCVRPDDADWNGGSGLGGDSVWHSVPAPSPMPGSGGVGGGISAWPSTAPRPVAVLVAVAFEVRPNTLDEAGYPAAAALLSHALHRVRNGLVGAAEALDPHTSPLPLAEQYPSGDAPLPAAEPVLLELLQECSASLAADAHIAVSNVHIDAHTVAVSEPRAYPWSWSSRAGGSGDGSGSGGSGGRTTASATPTRWAQRVPAGPAGGSGSGSNAGSGGGSGSGSDAGAGSGAGSAGDDGSGSGAQGAASGLSSGAVAGVAVGVIAAVALVGTALAVGGMALLQAGRRQGAEQERRRHTQRQGLTASSDARAPPA